MSNIISLQIENLRSISIQDLCIEDGKVNKIIGKNGGGKSTAIDALFIALQGASACKKFGTYNTAQVIKDGENKAIIKVAIKNEQYDFEIERVIIRKEDKAEFKKLSIVSRNGKTITANNVVDLFDMVSIDIVHFLNLAPKEQFEFLQKLVDADALADIDKDVQANEDRLHSYNKDKFSLDSRIREAKQTTPVAVADVAELIANNKKLQEDKHQYTSAMYHKELERKNIEEHEKKIIKLEQMIETGNARIHKLNDEVLSRNTLNVIENEIESNSEAMDKNQEFVQKKRDYDEYVANLSARDAIVVSIKHAKDLRSSINQKRAELFKEAGVSRDISYSESAGVTFDGKAIKDMSTGEQIRELITVTQSAFTEEQIRLLIIRNANVLDAKSLETISEVSQANNITVLCEWVSESENLSVEVV